MQNRTLSDLKRKLYDLFKAKDVEAKDVSWESGIVNYLLRKMFNPKQAPNKNFGLVMSSYGEDKEDFLFEASDLDGDEIKRLCEFLQVSFAHGYKSNEPIKLSREYVFGPLLKKLEEQYKIEQEQNPDEINRFVLKSRKIFESSAVNTLRNYSDEIIEMISKTKAKQKSADLSDLLTSSLTLSATVRNLRDYPALYENILNLISEFKYYLQPTSDVNNYPELVKRVNSILEGLELFKAYNQCESTIANRNFKEEMEELLNNNYQISAKKCPVIPDFLLNYIFRAQMGEKGEAKLVIGYDPARMVLHMSHVDMENTAKIIAFMSGLGDTTVMEGNGDREYGSALQMKSLEAPQLFCDGEEPEPNQEDEIEHHSVEMDGKFFYENIMPLLVEKLEFFKNYDSRGLSIYREASRAYLQKIGKIESEVNKPASCRLFSIEPTAPVPATATGSALAKESDPVTDPNSFLNMARPMIP